MLKDTIKTRGLHTVVRFAPQAILDKQRKRDFQIKANEGFDWQRQEFTDRLWSLTAPQSEGDPRSHLKLAVQPDSFSFEDSFPIGTRDVYKDNLKLALEVLASVFKPRIMLRIGVVIRLSAQSADDDARVYLGKNCLRLDDRLTPLSRPVHAVGLKLLLPPIQGEGQPNWQATVKVESLVEDVRQLYIEVDAHWGTPCQWAPQTAIDNLDTACQFSMNQVSDFLLKLGGES